MSVVIVPIDASQVPDQDRRQQRVKVAVQTRAGVRSQVVSVEGGKSEVKLEVEPGQAATIALGPDNVSDADLFYKQTLTVNIPAKQLGDRAFTLPPIVITPWWWRIWYRWCQTFTITGQVKDASGNPVPGAQVRAFDVNFFWWWSSVSQVGPAAITDANGNFTITFVHCCGWWPWWWWRLRQWRLDPDLINKIQPVLKVNPALRFAQPSPDLSIRFSELNPQPLPPRSRLATPVAAAAKLDPSTLPQLQEKLLSVLPAVPELERLRIWPWYPWYPWFNCDVNVIFQVTQNCGGGQTNVIVDENIFQTRWDIPTNLNVTLVANQNACSIPPGDPQPEGDCFVFTSVCGEGPGIPVTDIGGNAGLPSTVLDGFADPGGLDQPFAEGVTLFGLFGTSAQADYYQIQYTPHGANSWAPVPDAALRDMTRGYFDSTQLFPNQWFYPSFPVQHFNTVSGPVSVYESRQHYETSNPPPNWGSALSGRAWFLNADIVASLATNGNFSDGAYDFRVVGYTLLGNGDLQVSNGGNPLPGCGGANQNNNVVLYFDNRVLGAPIPGSVHVNTTEPDCGISSVTIGGNPVLPCGSQPLGPNEALDIAFSVSDPDGHLDYYTLNVYWGQGNVVDLLGLVDGVTNTLTTSFGHQVGPNYADAVAQGATRPVWNGGPMALHIANAAQVFPETCCYLIELTVYKRNIVSCGSPLYYNQMTYSFTVTV
jgi:hypothetical protein